MTGQALSNSVWALGRLVEAGCLDGSRGVPGVQRLAEEVQQRVRGRPGGFTPQDLSNLLLGVAHLQSSAQPGAYKLGAAIAALAAECHMGRGFQGFTSQDLSNAAWAVAKLGHGRQAWYAGCVEAALQPGFYTTAVPLGWSTLWWALANARHRPSDAQLLLKRTAYAAAALRDQFKAQECSSTLRSLATLGLYDRRLVGCLLGRLVELLPRGGVVAHNSSTALWAVAVMGPDALSSHVEEVGALLRDAASRWQQGGGGRAAFTKDALAQLWQAQSELEAHPAPEVRALAAVLPGAAGDGGASGSAMQQAAQGLRLPARRVCNQVGGGAAKDATPTRRRTPRRV